MGKPIDDHFLHRYRELLDAEDRAFDQLEHASEDGDRQQFSDELSEWQVALQAKLQWLEQAGYDLVPPGPGSGTTAS